MANKKLVDFVRRRGHAAKNKLLNYAGMSAELGIAERTLRDWAFKRKVPSFRVGHRTVLLIRKGQGRADQIRNSGRTLKIQQRGCNDVTPGRAKGAPGDAP